MSERPAGQTEAARALDRAEARLEKVRGETREILATSEQLKSLGRQNDFAARLKEALGGSG